MTTLEGRIRDDLRTIVMLSGTPMLEEAMTRGTDDSEAAMIVAPAADPDVWRARRRDENYRDHVEDRLGDQHPGWVLGTWDMLVREHLDQPTTLAVTVERAADYLARQLTDLARDPEFPIVEMADEIRACKTHLEQVLRAGDQVERGVPCLYDECGGKRIQRKLVWIQPKPNPDGTENQGWWEWTAWTCPSCDRTWDDDEYAAMVTAAHERTKVEHIDGQTWCTMQYAERITGRSWRTIQTWTRDDDDPLATLCLIAGRRVQFVNLAEVRVRHERTQRRTRRGAA